MRTRWLTCLLATSLLSSTACDDGAEAKAKADADAKTAADADAKAKADAQAIADAEAAKLAEAKAAQDAAAAELKAKADAEAAAAAAAEPEPEPEPEAKAGAKVKTAAKAKGTDAAAKAVYTAKCKSCHGDDGQGKTKFAEKNKIQDISKNKDSVTKIAAAIRDGVDGTKMKPFKDKLSEDEIKAVAAYVKTL
ncbi:MAG: cytochrome c [Nannocystis sp.]|nr:cytochrome c [Nannocystis sp.]